MGRRGMSVGARVVVLGSMVALLVPGLGHARFDPGCGREGEPIFAEITQPSGGSLTVVTAVTGPIAIDAAGDGIVLSTTGTVPVTIGYSCVTNLTLTVTKEAPGDPTVVHSQTWEDPELNTDDAELPCAQAEVSTDVEIGLDGGQYTFALSGMGCNGLPLVPSSSGRVVGDPPLGI